MNYEWIKKCRNWDIFIIKNNGYGGFITIVYICIQLIIYDHARFALYLTLSVANKILNILSV